MADWLILILDAFATYRLTRLWTKDTITHPLREAVIRWAYLKGGHDEAILEGDLEPMVLADLEDHTAPSLAVLMVCRWCASVWVAAGVTTARWVAPELWTPVAYGLALASLAVFAARLEDQD